ncbi:Broad specificity phosphatase PhoE [Pseudoxanthobacter soli DSM 19599]|uniref:Broad specificity phosphatase PhoE n=1 Tax=Pseudoxanthobacter soli DSM 19599 TaxID=1123029 RepID=A0A1M7ZN00_9HYPH|nr:histidine phosphatase family protein [Pseudoxanthobacter soli]SHO66278.1 Broad specificity phosphatase PhoE [Pseudoxanthobacter soli DSM 19599]
MILLRAGLFSLAMLLIAAFSAEVAAAPARVIILRHGEKGGGETLCSVGKERAEALAAQYLGKVDGASLLFDRPPAAFLAMTLHTLETATPIVDAWDMDLKTDPLMLEPAKNDHSFNAKLNLMNQRVANDLLTNPKWHGKTVVLVWEHYHIASEELESQFPGEQVTLRQLLHLDQLPDVPKTWPNPNYDYFWILHYDRPDATVPSSFRMMKQVFTAPYNNLPMNDWGQPENLPPGSGCT